MDRQTSGRRCPRHLHRSHRRRPQTFALILFCVSFNTLSIFYDGAAVHDPEHPGYLGARCYVISPVLLFTTIKLKFFLVFVSTMIKMESFRRIFVVARTLVLMHINPSALVLEYHFASRFHVQRSHAESCGIASYHLRNPTSESTRLRDHTIGTFQCRGANGTSSCTSGVAMETILILVRALGRKVLSCRRDCRDGY